MLGYNVHSLIERIDSAFPKHLKRALKYLFPNINQKYYSILRKLTAVGIIKTKILKGPLAGRYFYCSLRNERDYWRGIHEPEIQSFLTNNLHAGDIFYDIGVHVGYFSLLAASYIKPKGKVIGFEPNPSNRNIAKQNYDLNPDLSPFIQLEALAMSDTTSAANFVGELGSTTGRIIRESSSVLEARYTVNTISLDDFVARGNPPPNIIKMDIEGGEELALKGVMNVLQIYRPILLVEIHNADAAAQLVEILTTCKYKCQNMFGATFSSQRDYKERDHFIVSPAP